MSLADLSPRTLPLTMKLSSYLVLTTATLANLVLGTPAPLVEAQADVGIETSNPALVARGSNWAQCSISSSCKADGNGNVEVYIDTSGSWANDYGKGLLDNLRGQCGGSGKIYSWQFTYAGSDKNGRGQAHFYAAYNRICKTTNCGGNSHLCSSHCVEDAIWLASSGSGAIEGVNCKV
jgi:hypothetical protein